MNPERDSSMKPKTKSGNSRKSRGFTFTAPAANSVQLVGDFTEWGKHAINLRKGGEGVWHSDVELEPGEHHYRVLVDGEWRDDPECRLRVPNPYGSQDSVRQVG